MISLLTSYIYIYISKATGLEATIIIKGHYGNLQSFFWALNIMNISLFFPFNLPFLVF